MIIEKHPLPNDPTPAEAPPSYEEYQRHRPPGFPWQEKAEPPIPSSSSQSSPTSAGSSPGIITSLSSSSPTSVITKKSDKKYGKSKWFPFGQAARASQEVKKTVLNLVRDLVKVPDPNAAMGILQNCEEACAAHSLDFATILQESSLEGHTPIYWAIVKRPPENDIRGGEIDLVRTLLTMASPLTEDTISEIRLACLQNSDQLLFQRLRRLAIFTTLSGTDEMLLGADVPPDEVLVEDVPSDEGAFIVRFRLVLFQKRMRISKKVGLEFIARGRMWLLEFLEASGKDHGGKTYEKGTWLVHLCLMEHSPATYVDSRLVINDVRVPPRDLKPLPPPPPDESFMASLPGRLAYVSSGSEKYKPTIEIRLKTSSNAQLSPHPTLKSKHAGGNLHDLFVPLNKSLMGNSLQFDGSSYIASDGSLSARLEARLAKPDTECIIC